jgi:cobalamin biosynthesis Mg chelatase CobN
MSALEDHTVEYYINLGYTYEKAYKLAAFDSEKNSQARNDAAAAADRQVADAQVANKSFIDSLTSSLKDLISGAAQTQADQTQKSVQAVIDASSGASNSGSGAAPASGAGSSAYQYTPAQTAAAPAKPKNQIWIIVALVAVGVFYYYRRR